jgi:hypothetical protein
MLTVSATSAVSIVIDVDTARTAQMHPSAGLEFEFYLPTEEGRRKEP